MKIALLADVHANLPALAAAMLDARDQGAEAIWNLGDFVGYGAMPDQVVRRLREVEALSIIGNYDQKVLAFEQNRQEWSQSKSAEKFVAFEWAWEHLSEASKQYLASLPQELRLTLDRVRFLLSHGSPAEIDETVTASTPDRRLAELADLADVDVIACGHSHEPFVRTVDGATFVNPGSVGRPEAFDPRASYAMLTVSDGELSVELCRVEYDVAEAVDALRDAGLPDSFGQMLQQGASLATVQSTPAAPAGEVADLEDAVDAARALARKCDYEAGHTDQVTRLALELFDQLQHAHGLDDRDRLLLNCAGLLHDIGWQAGAKGHHKTAMRLILAAKDLPLSSADRTMVALVARYHRKALPRNGHPHVGKLAKSDKRRVRLLAGLLRVADGLDRSHGNIVENVRCELTEQRLTVQCRTSGPALAELEAARKKGNLLENALHRVLTIDVATG
jgi:putative phosphoesterase